MVYYGLALQDNSRWLHVMNQPTSCQLPVINLDTLLYSEYLITDN